MQARPLIYIHGFRSSPLSGKSRALKKIFPGIILATYDTLHPDIAFLQLDALIGEAVKRQSILIGSSLGGFWAYQFAKRYALSCVLLNPCMRPEVTLRPDIGVVTNMYTDEQGIMTEDDLRKYDAYRFAGNARCVVLHEKGDELIPYTESVANFQGNAKLVLIEGGSHAFEHLQAAIDEIHLLASE